MRTRIMNQLQAVAMNEGKRWKRKLTRPGVGPLTGLAYVLVIGTPERFPCGKQIGSCLEPCEDSSATRQWLGHISKQNNALLRFLLVEAAQAAARYNPDWRRRYVHLMMAPGKKNCVAEQLGLFAVGRIRFARGKARNRTQRELERRPLDWASRSLKRSLKQ
jgi:hypothetical protein